MTNSASTSGTLRPEQLFALTVGILLLLSGLLHALVWLVDGGSLAGPVSWRKPILFGVSAGITVLSMGWLVGKMRRRVGDLLLIGGFSLAMFVEVGLITMQQWRGVASHFNRSTSIVGFTVFSLAQTFSGRARFDTSVASTCPLAATVGLAFMAVRSGLYRIGRRLLKVVATHPRPLDRLER